MQKDFDLGEYFLKQIKEKETGNEFDFLETKKTFNSGNNLLIHKYGLNDNKLLSLDIPVLNSTIIVKFPENKIVYRIMNEYPEDSDIMKKAFIEGYLVSSKHYSGQEVTFENINIAKEDKDYEELKRLLAMVDLYNELRMLKD